MLIVLRVEDYHAVAGIVQAGCKFGPVRRVGHTPYSVRVVAPHGAVGIRLVLIGVLAMRARTLLIVLGVALQRRLYYVLGA